MKRQSALALLVGVALAAAGCQQQKKAATPAASPTASPGATAGMSEDQKAVYAYGAVVGQQLAAQTKPLQLTQQEQEAFKKGFETTLSGGKPDVNVEEYGPKFQTFAQSRLAAGAADQKQAAAAEKQKAAPFCAQAEREPGAVKLPSGLIYRTLKPGSGRSPKATDAVQVNYRGTLIDGTEFDASTKHGGPVGFRLNGVIPCWTEGIARMKTGEQARLVCPSEIAYGDAGQPPTIPPGATLVFEVELLQVRAASAAPAR